MVSVRGRVRVRVRVGWAAMAMAVGAVWGMTAARSPRGLAFVRASKRSRDLALILSCLKFTLNLANQFTAAQSGLTDFMRFETDRHMYVGKAYFARLVLITVVDDNLRSPSLCWSSAHLRAFL